MLQSVGRLACACSILLSAGLFASACGGSGALPPGHGVAPQRPQDLDPAERAFLEARFDLTVELLTESKRDSVDGLLLAFTHFLEGDDVQCEKVFRETMRVPTYSQEFLFRSLLAVLTGDEKKAVKFMGKERKLPQRRFFALAMYVEFLISAKRLEEAKAEIVELKSLYPEETIVHHTEGHLRAALEEWQASIDAYRRSEQLGGPNPDLDEGIAKAQIGLADYAAARRTVAKCSNQFPAYAEILYFAIRIEQLDLQVTPEELAQMIAEYQNKTKRKDRLEELQLGDGEKSHH